MKRLLFYLTMVVVLSSYRLSAYGQRDEIYSNKIATVQVMLGDNWLAMPVMELNGETPIYISFDYLGHDYRRFSYKIEHCDADWSVSSSLFSSDFIEGIAEGNIIEDNNQSVGTNTIYTHYQLSIPNNHIKLKMSGNYRVTVIDDDSGDRMFSACFMVLQQKVSVSLSATTNTDVDINDKHQQLKMKLSYGQINVTDPTHQIKTVVMQNCRWSNCVVNAKPDYITNDELMWQHSRDFIFNAGNEYHKFEATDVNHSTLGIESIKWDGHDYNAFLWADDPCPNYVYDEDADGAFYIRNYDDIDNETTCEYINVHFRLKAPLQNGDVYINGRWTDDAISDKYKMEYDELGKFYTKTLKLKQGYYSYQYVLATPSGKLMPVTTDGNFYQTENSYQALIYYRGQSDRTDMLVGYAEIKM